MRHEELERGDVGRLQMENVRLHTGNGQLRRQLLLALACITELEQRDKLAAPKSPLAPKPSRAKRETAERCICCITPLPKLPYPNGEQLRTRKLLTFLRTCVIRWSIE